MANRIYVEAVIALLITLDVVLFVHQIREARQWSRLTRLGNGRPTALGARDGTLTIDSNASRSPSLVESTGEGAPPRKSATIEREA